MNLIFLLLINGAMAMVLPERQENDNNVGDDVQDMANGTMAKTENMNIEDIKLQIEKCECDKSDAIFKKLDRMAEALEASNTPNDAEKSQVVYSFYEMVQGWVMMATTILVSLIIPGVVFVWRQTIIKAKNKKIKRLKKENQDIEKDRQSLKTSLDELRSINANSRMFGRFTSVETQQSVRDPNLPTLPTSLVIVPSEWI